MRKKRFISKKFIILLTILLMTFSYQLANAEFGPSGDEWRVNTYTSSNQSYQNVAMDQDGDFVVTWESFGQDGSGYGIYAQRYSSDGTPQGGEFRVNTYTSNNQNYPDVAMDQDGDFVVTWQSFGQDGSSSGVYARRYSSDGTPQGGEFRVNTYTSNSQSYPCVAMGSEGEFVIAWMSDAQDGSDWGVYAQKFDVDGVPFGGEFRVNTYATNYQRSPSVSMRPEGNFVITWESWGQDGSDNGVYAQRFGPDCTPQGSEFRVNTYTNNSQQAPSIAMDPEGNFVIVWESREQDGSILGVFAQRFAGDGTPLGSEFLVNTTTESDQDYPRIAMDSDGNFVVVWESYGQDGLSYGIFAQRFAGDGTPDGEEFQVNTTTESDQDHPRIAMDSDGNFVVAWASANQDGSGYGVYAQRYEVSNSAYTSTAFTDRIGGDDRIETAIEISKYTKKSEGSGEVILCTSENWPDALSAAALAGAYNANILLNPSDELDERVKDELERIAEAFQDPLNVTLIGGTGALSEDVEDELKDMNEVGDTERVGGKDRYETSAKVAEKLSNMNGIGHFFVCSGENWPDAMVAAPEAYNCSSVECHTPILLTKKDDIPDATLDFILSHKSTGGIWVIGGEGVVSSSVMQDLGYYMNSDVKRIAGDDRYETCVAFMEDPDMWDWDRNNVEGSNTVTFATGNNWPDALCGSVLGEPLLLAGSLDESITDYFSDSFDNGNELEFFGIILGKKGAIDKETEDDIAEALSDGAFDPTTEEPAINSFDVTINPDNDLPDVAQYDSDDWVVFDVEVDEHIWNEDGVLGSVFVEDISELGGKEAPYNEDDFDLDWISGSDSSDNTYYGEVLVKKKSTDPDQREVTFVARAENQAGSDTMESDAIEVYN